MPNGLGTRAEAAKQRANLAGLLFCSLSIFSICLTIFNLYLLHWIWSSLSSSSIVPISASSSQVEDHDSPLPVQLNLFDQLELLRDESKIAFQDKLLAKKPIQVQKVKQINEGATLRLSSPAEVQFKINEAADVASLIVSSTRESLEFPQGLIVRGNSQPLASSLECRPTQKAAPFCHLHARQLELTRPEGVDFGALKSIQTSQLRTRRLHSSLNKLQLMTGTGEISFESRGEQIHLRALDLVSLGSRNSTVIIKAKTIKLGDLNEIFPAELNEPGKQHKLCVCLKEERREQEEETYKKADENTNSGLVFVIQSHLRCSQFTETKCSRIRPKASAD